MSDMKMGDSAITDQPRGLEPVHSDERSRAEMRWTARLVLFLRVMAGLSMLMGLYHWAQVCGIWVAPGDVFEAHSVAWQAATIFFAVLDLVAAVGLWLAAAWGAVIWLTAVASMITVDVFFPQVFGGGLSIDMVGALLLGIYLWLALKSAREQPA
jgi:uncharacterized membrane protein (DUF2068 family)